MPSAPKGHPNLTNAGKGAPRKPGQVRINTQVSEEAKAFLIELGGSPRKIGAAIEELVDFWRNIVEVSD